MKFLRLLLNSGLILICARIILADENLEINFDSTDNEYRLPNYIRPTHYDIQLRAKEDPNGIISGVSNINISIYAPTRYIWLHAQKEYITISEAILYIITNEYKLELYKLEDYSFNIESHILTFNLKDEISRGYYNLKIIFVSSGGNSREGLFKTTYLDGNKYETEIGTNFYPIRARQIFPCWDEPGIRATFNITSKYYPNYSTLYNREKQGESESKFVFTHSFTTPAMPTCRIFIEMLRWNMSPFENMWRRIIPWHRRGYKIPVTRAYRIFNEVRLQGLKWGFQDINVEKMIIIPGFQYDGISYWNHTLYRELAVMYWEGFLTLREERLNVACLVARGTARYWFDSLVSPSWWSHSWLHEGLATLLGLDAINETTPDYRMLSLVQIRHESLRLDTESIMQPLITRINSPSEINSLFSFSYYIKAPTILYMLQHLVTHEVFRKGIFKYLNTHSNRSATVDNFWTAIQNALTESQQSKFDLKEVLYAWTHHAHYPVLNVVQDHLTKTIRIWQQNVNTMDSTKWLIPVTYITRNKDFNYTPSNNIVWIPPSSKNFPVNLSDENDIIIVNLQQTGYYRVNYDAKTWMKIAENLNSEEYAKLHVLNRAQIIDDAYHFLITDRLNLDTFLKFMDYLKQETNYIVWYPMIKAFEDMSCFFPFPLFRHNKNKIRIVLDELLEKIKYGHYSFREGDISDFLINEAAKWACIADSYECQRKADSRLQWIFNTTYPDIEDRPHHWAFCNGLRTSSDFFSTLFNEFKTHLNNTNVKFLACSKNPDKICRFLDHIVSKYYDKAIQDIDYVNIIHSIIERHAEHHLVLDCILDRFENITIRDMSGIVVLNDIINHIYSEIRLNKITIFVENHLKNATVTIISNVFFNREMQFDKVNECIKNLDKPHEKIVSLIKRKIEMRLSQIKNQLNRIHKFNSRITEIKTEIND